MKSCKGLKGIKKEGAKAGGRDGGKRQKTKEPSRRRARRSQTRNKNEVVLVIYLINELQDLFSLTPDA
jgi:hypothetical protein